MNKYGVEESWTKMFAIEFKFGEYRPRDFDVIKLLHNGNVLLKYCEHFMDDSLFSYNLATKSAVKVEVNGTPLRVDAVVELEDVVGDITIMEENASKVMEVWRMNEYGVSESWKKMLVMDLHYGLIEHPAGVNVMKFLENGNIILKLNCMFEDVLFIYNPETKVKYGRGGH